IFVKEWTQTLYAVADNVSITAAFNPSMVKTYRLIGFENKKTVLLDTASKIEGGEIGSGQSLMALFELQPADSLTGIDKIADINVNYCLPNQKESMVADYTCPGDIVSFVKADSAFKQAACIAMFGMKLRQSGYASSISWKNIESIANSCFSKYDP